MGSKSTIAIFLPIFFSVLVICGVCLCACAFCQKTTPSLSFLRFIPFFGGRSGDSEYSDPEKGPEVIRVDPEVARPRPRPHSGGHNLPGHFQDGEEFEVEEGDPNAEVIEVVDVHPDLD